MDTGQKENNMCFVQHTWHTGENYNATKKYSRNFVQLTITVIRHLQSSTSKEMVHVTAH